MNYNNQRFLRKLSASISFVVVGLFASLFVLAPRVNASLIPSTASTTVPAMTTNSGITFTSLTVDDKEDFIVEPGKMEVHVNPGDTVTEYIAVTSRILSATEFGVSTEDFVGSTDQNSPVILLGNKKSPYSLKDWLTPASSDFTMKFGDRVTLPVTITVPKDVSPGGYYAAVIVSNAPQVNTETVSGGSVAKVISRIGVLFFVRVNGPVNASGQLEDFSINPAQKFYSSTPTDFQVLFNNNGSIYLAPYGEIHIHNFFGSEIADLPVDAYFAMPDALRYRHVYWNDSGAFRIGRYTATISLNRSYSNIIDTRTIVFWVLPWKIIVVSLLVIIVIATIGYLFFTRFEFRRKK